MYNVGTRSTPSRRMKSTFNIETAELLVVFVLPGLVSMQVYRLLMPARDMKWADALLQGFFYSSINFALLFPLVYWYSTATSPSLLTTWGMLVAYVFAGPSTWPWLLARLFQSGWFRRRARVPYPSSWDYFFDQDDEAFLLIHLRDGSIIGGYWGPHSHAGQYPRDGDLYLEALYHINEDGTFSEPVEYTQGLLIRRDEYSHVELFHPPPSP